MPSQCAPRFALLSSGQPIRLAGQDMRALVVFVPRGKTHRVIIKAMFPAIFLDRDGVIIENRAEYVRRWEDVVFLPGALAALENLRRLPYKLILITNQSMVGRGLVPKTEAEAIAARILEVVTAHGGHFDAVYTCYHAPADLCECRKPRPGLLMQAAAALSLDLSRSIMVGDALTDLQAGQNAGVKQTFLVRTGRGAAQALLPAAAALRPFVTCDTLADVVTYLSLNE